MAAIIVIIVIGLIIYAIIAVSNSGHEHEVEDLCESSKEMLVKVDERFAQMLKDEPPNDNTKKYVVDTYVCSWMEPDPDNTTHIWISGNNLVIVNKVISILTSYINDTVNREIMGNVMRSRLSAGPDNFLHIRHIPVNNIQYFWREGDIAVTQDVSGGGVNMGGAIAGGLLAGSTGAVIGSRVGTNIKTETKSIDRRRVVLMYTDEDGKSQDLSLCNSAHKVLMHLIPEKEYSQVLASKAPAQNTGSAEDKLKQLQSLLDQNLITQDEYNAKRQDILSQL